MASKVTSMILEVLATKDEVTLNELYAVVGENPDLVWETSVMKHRVRSSLYSLQQANKVERSAAKTYKLV